MPAMRTGILFGACALVCFGLATAPRAAEEESWFGFDFSLRMSNRFSYKLNFLNTEGSLSAAGTNGPGRQVGLAALLESEDPINLRFDKGELGYSALLGVAARLRLGQALGLQLSFDSGELKLPWLMRYSPTPDCHQAGLDPRCQVTSSGRPVLDEAAESFFLREAFVELGVGLDDWFSARAGKLLLSTGNGYLMDNYALGVATIFDLELGFDLPVKIAADLVFPDGRFSAAGKRSPYLYLDVAYLTSFLEEIGLFFAWYHDGDDNLARIMYSVLGEALLNNPETELAYLSLPQAELSSRGDLFWVGLRANWVFDRASLSATAIVEFGEFDFGLVNDDPVLQIQTRARCLGGMVDLQAHYDLADWLTVGAFFLFLSGETFSADNPSAGLQERYSSFISIYPYITHTNLFFSGGMNQNFSSRSFSTSGVNGRGVIAPGLTAGVDLGEDVSVRLVGAALVAHGRHLTSQGSFYGVETDLNFEWALHPQVRVLFEADYLYTGDFFDFRKPLEPCLEGMGQRCPVPRFEQEPDAFKLLVGLDISY